MKDCFQPFLTNTNSVFLNKIPKVLERENIWDDRIESNWQRLVEQKKITENATLLHVNSFQSKIINVEPSITYKDIVGIRSCGQPHNAPYRALSALAVTVSSDGYWLLRERNSGDWNHSYEFIGGFVRAEYDLENLDFFIRERFNREMVHSRIHSFSCLGYYDFASILEHMCIYEIVTEHNAIDAVNLYGDSVVAISKQEVMMYMTGAYIYRLPLHIPSRLVLSAILQHDVGFVRGVSLTR